MKPLPVGLQIFRDIIEGGCAYVDKTQYVYNLIKGKGSYFLSRPRRFGKSLLLDTIAEAFSGDKELFKGLYIYDSDYDFAKHPVLRLDMSRIANETPEIFKISLITHLRKRITEEGLNISDEIPSDIFQSLIEGLEKKYNQRVVILIDEYDVPILDHINDLETADSIRATLHSFYRVIKGMDLRFVFITGVTKFTKTSIFSGLNNLRDITLVDEYANICGIPADELEKQFGEHIEALGTLKKFKDHPNLTDAILTWYDGYSWDGKTRVINPFALLCLLDYKKFASFWFASGSPSFLIGLLKKKPESFFKLKNLEITEGILDKCDIHDISIEPLLFQTGYLTVAEKRMHGFSESYLLRIPNFEVEEALYLSIIADYTRNSDSFAESAYESIRKSLETGDLQGMLETLRALFASIPYELHPPMEAKKPKQKGQQPPPTAPTEPPPSEKETQARTQAESYYHSIFLAVLSLLGFDIEAETPTSRGKIDAVLEHSDKIYVMEFKYAPCPLNAPQDKKRRLLKRTLDAAMKQITEKGYSDKYAASGKTIYHVAITFIGRDNIEMRATINTPIPDPSYATPALDPPNTPQPEHPKPSESQVCEKQINYTQLPPTTSTDKDAALAEKDAEIARLRALLEQRG